MKGPLFYAKILLFGEYGIIKDSKGLAIPYNVYQGALQIPTEITATTQDSNQKLWRFYQYLNQLDKSLVVFRLDDLKSDLEQGLYTPLRWVRCKK